MGGRHRVGRFGHDIYHLDIGYAGVVAGRGGVVEARHMQAGEVVAGTILAAFAEPRVWGVGSLGHNPGQRLECVGQDRCHDTPGRPGNYLFGDYVVLARCGRPIIWIFYPSTQIS